MQDKVEQVLNEEVRPALALHGGNVELIEISADNVVKVKLTGACAGCPMAQMTILTIVERAIKARIPEVKQVIA
ncbi:MAG: NifU family protein [Candidatus Stahlbacteria bacterium]|nr:NifU family protein [Candidatus Stahlbacteria bacterium]